jgi:hypothetical protein
MPLSSSESRRESWSVNHLRAALPAESPCPFLGAGSRPNGPHFRPHISATPRDETDTEQHVFLKTMDMRYETDTEQQLESSF